MKLSRFSEEQIIAILKEQEAGMATAEVCCRPGVSSATFYKWKSKFGGLEVSETRRLWSLEEENSRLKKLLAEPMQNGFVKSFNGRLRDECLGETRLTSLVHARFVLAAWQHDYDTVRPCSKLGGKTPPRSSANVPVGMPQTRCPYHQTTIMKERDSTSEWQQSGGRHRH